MNTNRSFRNIVVLFVIAILATMLTACSGNAAQDAINFMASAYSDDSAASQQALTFSPRIKDCSISDQVLMGNELKAAVNPQTGEIDNITIGAWLDEQAKTRTCIKPLSK